MNRIPRTLEALLARTTVNEGGCMEWVGTERRKKLTYPCMKWNGKNVPITRIVLELSGHDMSNPDIHALHKCDNKLCINPDHLFPGTRSENTKDFWDKVKGGILHRRKWNEQKRAWD